MRSLRWASYGLALLLLFALAPAQAQFQQPVTAGASIPSSATLQNAAVANANGTSLDIHGMSSAILTVNCATCSGGTQVNFEATEDNTNWFSVNATQAGTNNVATSTTTAGLTAWQIPVAGYMNLRARVSAYSAGTVTVTGHAVPVDFNSRTVGLVQGCTFGKTLSAASTNSTSVTGAASTLCSLSLINTTATLYYFKLYNKATAPTCNSDTVIQTIPVPASATGAGVVVNVGPYGSYFSAGIGFCLTGALADNDNTNAATGVAINYSSK
jgi:hypothetical protein